MSLLLKVLITLGVALPLAAFVVGSLVATSEETPTRERIIIRDDSGERSEHARTSSMGSPVLSCTATARTYGDATPSRKPVQTPFHRLLPPSYRARAISCDQCSTDTRLITRGFS